MTTQQPDRSQGEVSAGSVFSVLLATDGQPAAEAAEQLVRRLADPDRVAVTVLGVSSYELALREGKRLEGRYSPDAARRHVEKTVTATAERLVAAGITTEAHIEHDDPTLRILETAERRGSDLIVLGGRRWGLPGPASALDRFREDPPYTPPSASDDADTATLVDSVSTRVLHRAEMPVMVVHGQPVGRPDDAEVRVIVGADGSSPSTSAIRTFGAFADPTSVEVQIVSVVEPSPNLSVGRSPSGAPMIAVGSRMAEVDEETAQAAIEFSHADANAAAADAADTLRQLGFQVQVATLEGATPANTLLDHVREVRAALAVVGSRGLGLVRRTLLGSVSETLVHDAPATLVAKAPDSAN